MSTLIGSIIGKVEATITPYLPLIREWCAYAYAYAEEDKKRLEQAIYAYMPMLTLAGICTHLLEYKYTPPLQLVLASSFVWYWAYGIHRLHHHLPSTGIFSYLNPHMAIHHSHVTLPRWLELTVETLHNIFWFFLLYLLQEYTNIHIAPTSIVVLSMLVYSSVHVINYSIFGSEKHRRQHENPDVNFGPDFLDHVFGTNSDEEFEDMNHFIPNFLVSTFLIYYLR
jgi:hypothetical protein